VLLLSVAYAMVVQNLALGIFCGLLLFSPLVLTGVWVPFAWSEVIRQRLVERALLAFEAETAG
jgi:hypothetical protein